MDSVGAAAAGDELVGRDADLVAVRTLLDDGGRLVTITGPGGVGKTRLAREVVRSFDAAAGHVLFVPLVSVVDAALVLTAIADRAAVRLGADDSVLDAVAAAFGSDPSLVVLDNFEHVRDSRSDLELLLKRCDGVQILVTSRIALGLADEQEVDLAPLGDDDSMTLFAQRAAHVLPGFGADEFHDATFRAICARLDGLPLAIELAASRLRVLSPQELASTLEEGIGVLRSPRRSNTHHHRALHAAIEWSYRLLDADDRRLLRALSVLPGSFNRDGAAAVAALDPLDALDGIDRLLDHHLLRSLDDHDGARRFDMLASIREFAASELAASREQPDVRARTEALAVAFVEQYSARLTGPEQPVALARIDREVDNLRVALGWAATSRDDTVGLRLVAGLWRYWWMRGRLTEGREWCERVLAAYEGPDNVELANALRAAGQLTLQFPLPDVARDYLDRACEMFEHLGDELGQADCWTTLGLFVNFDGDVERSESLQRAALDVYRRHDRHRDAAVALNGLATAAHLRGEFAEALRLGHETIAMLRQAGDLRSVAVMLGVVGENQLALGDAAGAVPLYEECLSLATQQGDQWGISQAMSRLGRALVCAEQRGKAVAMLREANRAAEASGDNIAAAMASLWLARCAELDGDLATAGALAVDSLRRSIEMAHSPGTRAALQRIACLTESTGDVAAAVQLAHAGLHSFAEPGDGGFGVETRFLPSPSVEVQDPSEPELEALRSVAGEWSAEQTIAAAIAAVAAIPREPAAPEIDPAVADELGLTARERELIASLVRRRTDREIAAEFTISVRTASTHVAAILRKLGVRSRRDVAHHARSIGLIAARHRR